MKYKNKKIIFFDADGTLWYPWKTKRKENPIWIHREYHNVEEIRAGLTLVPNLIKTLDRLKGEGIRMVVLSASPLPARKAIEAMTAGSLCGKKIHIKNIATIPPIPEPSILAK